MTSVSVDGLEAATPESTPAIADRYRRMGLRRTAVLLLSFVLLILLAGWVGVRGVSNTSIGELLAVVGERITFGLYEADVPLRTEQVLLHLRLPRIVLAILAGAGLSLSGVLMQAITRNPLVSPYTTGVSSAAAFGAAIAIMFGVGLTGGGRYIVPIAAFAFAFGCAGLVFSMAWLRGMSAQTLVLTGIALMYLFSALTAAIQFFATQEQLARVVHWTFGSLNGAAWDTVAIVAVVFAVLLPLVWRTAWPLNALTSAGDDVARSLGINVARLRVASMTFAVLLAAVVISFTGVIGFIGLVGPHVARLVIGTDHRALIPFAMISGAALLLIADTIGRLVFSPIVIPVGIVIAIVGVPVFFHLVLSRRREYVS
jgi:iron complex transport system permease protein